MQPRVGAWVPLGESGQSSSAVCSPQRRSPCTSCRPSWRTTQQATARRHLTLPRPELDGRSLLAAVRAEWIGDWARSRGPARRALVETLAAHLADPAPLPASASHDLDPLRWLLDAAMAELPAHPEEQPRPRPRHGPPQRPPPARRPHRPHARRRSGGAVARGRRPAWRWAGLPRDRHRAGPSHPARRAATCAGNPYRADRRRHSRRRLA
jgi:hypothetical protein